jgi:hypothetical protein
MTLIPLFVAPDAGWSTARTMSAYAQQRSAALHRLADGGFRLEGDPATYRVTLFAKDEKGRDYVFGVYEDKEALRA